MNRVHSPSNRCVVAQGKENCFSKNGSIARTQHRIGFEEGLHQLIGGAIQLQNHSKRPRELFHNKACDANSLGIEADLAGFGGRSLMDFPFDFG